MGDDAVPRREDVREIGPHLLIDGDRALDAELGSCPGG
jgi:hypothetical protein